MIKTPALIRGSFFSMVWRLPATDNKVYLTFDDGPVPEVTPYVLSQLKRFNALATFFCVGKNIQQHPDLFLEIIRQGHGTGNHTFSHFQGWRTPLKSYLQDIIRCKQEMEKHGVSPGLFRPPYGKVSRNQLKAIHPHFRVIMWDILSYDWDSTFHPEKSLRLLKKHTRPGSIIVMHDSHKAYANLSQILPGYLQFLCDNHFKPDIIS